MSHTSIFANPLNVLALDLDDPSDKFLSELLSAMDTAFSESYRNGIETYCTLTELWENLSAFPDAQAAVEFLQKEFDEELFKSAASQGDGNAVSLNNLIKQTDLTLNKERWFIQYDEDDVDNVDSALYLVHRAFQAAEKKGLGEKRYVMSFQATCAEMSWGGSGDADTSVICITSSQIWSTHTSNFESIFLLEPKQFRFITDPELREHVYGWFEQMGDSIGCCITRSENSVTVFPQTISAAMYVWSVRITELVENIRKHAAVHLAAELSKNKKRKRKQNISVRISALEAKWSLTSLSNQMEISAAIMNASKS